MLSRVLAVAASAVLVLSLAACGSDDSATDSTGGSPAGSPSVSPSTGGSGKTCSYPTDPQGAAKPVNPPPSQAAYSGTVKVTMSTSIGSLDLTLDADRAPCTVNSFLSLAKQGYFDNTSCHRLTTAAAGISVLQCGDPTGTGSGTPGYSFNDELTGHEHYGAGVLAMANAGPNTNGSQFFVVYADSSSLDHANNEPPAYTIFGSISPSSLTKVATAAAAGTTTGQPDGAPKIPVNISKVTIG